LDVQREVQREPIALVTLILSVIRSGLAFSVGMGWIILTESQMEQALVFAGALFLLIDVLATVWMRQQVTPVFQFRKRVQEAINAGKHDEVRAPILPKPVTPPPSDVVAAGLQ
jgi:hypothetical protein